MTLKRACKHMPTNYLCFISKVFEIIQVQYSFCILSISDKVHREDDKGVGSIFLKRQIVPYSLSRKQPNIENETHMM